MGHKSKKTISIIVGFSGLLGLGLVVLAWLLSSSVMYPSYSCSEEHFIYCNDPSQLSMPFEDISFQSVDGERLSGWYIPVKNATKAVIFVHGHGADRHEGMRWFSALHQAGLNILAFDLRNNGASTGSFSSMGFFEQRDVRAAVDYLSDHKQIQHIGIFGTSMGATTSVLAMAKDTRIGAAVFEAGWSNLTDLYKEIIRQHMSLPSFPLLPLTIWLLEQRTGIDMDALNPEDILAGIAPRPIAFIHCSDDNLINFSHAERNYTAANQPKALWQASCKIHARAWQSDSASLEKRIFEFYLRYL